MSYGPVLNTSFTEGGDMGQMGLSQQGRISLRVQSNGRKFPSPNHAPRSVKCGHIQLAAKKKLLSDQTVPAWNLFFGEALKERAMVKHSKNGA